MKTDQNTELENIDIFKHPETETLPFRYILASSFCKNKDVLDASTGAGYGAQILTALGAKSVLGIDLDSDKINQAKILYKNNAVNYMEADLCEEWGDELNNKFNTIISIETFEHLPKEKIQIYLSNLKKSLKNGGHIFITTPQRLSTKWKYDGGTHLYEYNVEEFAIELDKAFGSNFVLFGLQEIRIGDIGQLISIVKNNVRESHIMCALIHLNEE